MSLTRKTHSSLKKKESSIVKRSTDKTSFPEKVAVANKMLSETIFLPRKSSSVN